MLINCHNLSADIQWFKLHSKYHEFGLVALAMPISKYWIHSIVGLLLIWPSSLVAQVKEGSNSLPLSVVLEAGKGFGSFEAEGTKYMLRAYTTVPIKSWLHTGLGVGFEQFTDVSILPVFLVLRNDLPSQHRFTFYGHIGVPVVWNNQASFDETKGKWLVEPGINWRPHRKLPKLHIGLGYKIQRYSTLETREGFISGFEAREITTRRLNLTLAYQLFSSP